jgi:hypothetical protein
MASELTSHIRRTADLNGVGVLAGPKRGNALLMAKTAYALGLTPIFIKERPLFGKWLEGVDGDPGRRSLLTTYPLMESSWSTVSRHCANAATWFRMPTYSLIGLRVIPSSFYPS